MSPRNIRLFVLHLLCQTINDLSSTPSEQSSHINNLSDSINSDTVHTSNDGASVPLSCVDTKNDRHTKQQMVTQAQRGIFKPRVCFGKYISFSI